jgi:hypothetical protein
MRERRKSRQSKMKKSKRNKELWHASMVATDNPPCFFFVADLVSSVRRKHKNEKMKPKYESQLASYFFGGKNNAPSHTYTFF